MIEIIPNWHPIAVHFTLALLLLSVVFYLLLWVWPAGPLRDQVHGFARWNLLLGTVSALLSVTAGWFAFNSVTHDDLSHAAMVQHRDLALITLPLFMLLALWALLRGMAPARPSALFTLLLVLAGGSLLTTAWRGGELVYRYGLGVMALPVPDVQEGHDHAHHGDVFSNVSVDAVLEPEPPEAMPRSVAPVHHHGDDSTPHPH